MQKIKKVFSKIYKKYERSKFRNKIEKNPVGIAIILALVIPLITDFFEDLETKKTSQTLPIIVQEVFFIENNSIVKIIVIR